MKKSKQRKNKVLFINGIKEVTRERAFSFLSNKNLEPLVTAYFEIEKYDGIEMLQEWAPDPAPQWVTCIPSLKHPELVPDFASKLANALGLPFVRCIKKVRANKQQKSMENSYHQARNLDGVFNVNLELKDHQPCLLVDDMIDSGWTFTVASALLRQAGCSAVYPMALALNSPRMD